jgi:phage terminase large subunit GpA-like protein
LKGGGLDTGGHYTTQAYKFCKKNQARNFLALKGSNQLSAPLTSRPSRNNSERVKLFSIGTTEAKDMIYGCLKLPEPGAGYVHFPMSLDEEYFEQMTGEKKITEYREGRPIRKYKAFRPRVEALDCYVYARAALEILKVPIKSLARDLVPGAPAAKPKAKARKQRETSRRGNGGGWFDRYK